MKKVIAILLCVVMLLSLAACGDNKDTDADKGAEFVAPENYAAVVRVSINPDANLYVDAQNVVLAVEYLNKDAEDTYTAIESGIVGASLATGVKTLIAAASDAGFFAEEKTVTVDVAECKDGTDKKVVLAVAASAAKRELEDKKIDAPLTVKDGGNAVDEETYKEVIGEVDGNGDATAEATEAATEAPTDEATTEATAEPTVVPTSAPTAAPTAVPTAIPTATPAPTAAPTAVPVTLKKNTRYVAERESEFAGQFENAVLLTFITFYDDGTYGIGQGDYSTEPMSDDCIVWKGQNYYAMSGLGSSGEYTVSGNTVTLVQDNVILTLNAAGKLVVASCDPESIFEVGMVFEA